MAKATWELDKLTRSADKQRGHSPGAVCASKDYWIKRHIVDYSPINENPPGHPLEMLSLL